MIIIKTERGFFGNSIGMVSVKDTITSVDSVISLIFETKNKFEIGFACKLKEKNIKVSLSKEQIEDALSSNNNIEDAPIKIHKENVLGNDVVAFNFFYEIRVSVFLSEYFVNEFLKKVNESLLEQGNSLTDQDIRDFFN